MWCWWLIFDVANIMLVPNFWCEWRYQHIWSPTSVTNIDVTHFKTTRVEKTIICSVEQVQSDKSNHFNDLKSFSDRASRWKNAFKSRKRPKLVDFRKNIKLFSNRQGLSKILVLNSSKNFWFNCCIGVFELLISLWNRLCEHWVWFF